MELNLHPERLTEEQLQKLSDEWAEKWVAKIKGVIEEHERNCVEPDEALKAIVDTIYEKAFEDGANSAENED